MHSSPLREPTFPSNLLIITFSPSRVSQHVFQSRKFNWGQMQTRATLVINCFVTLNCLVIQYWSNIPGLLSSSFPRLDGARIQSIGHRLLNETPRDLTGYREQFILISNIVNKMAKNWRPFIESYGWHGRHQGRWQQLQHPEGFTQKFCPVVNKKKSLWILNPAPVFHPMPEFFVWFAVFLFVWFEPFSTMKAMIAQSPFETVRPCWPKPLMSHSHCPS